MDTLYCQEILQLLDMEVGAAGFLGVKMRSRKITSYSILVMRKNK